MLLTFKRHSLLQDNPGITYPKRIASLGVLILLGFLVFSFIYRLPQLFEISANSFPAQSIDVLTEHPIISYSDSTDFALKALYSTINWVATNIPGMLFGLYLGSALLALFSWLPTIKKESPYLDLITGIALGIPLGVCVNCAMPVAKGMIQGGNRPGIPMALMFSSPVLNIIVITMTFSLLPPAFGLIKYLLTLIFLLAILPVLLRRTYWASPFKGDTDEMACQLAFSSQPENWKQAITTSLKHFFQCFLYLMRKTAGWMLLAGLAGAFVSHVMPLQSFSTQEVTLFSLILLSCVGVFLPVPIAFDVIMAKVLYSAGLPPQYVMILLMTLGTYSIFPFLVLWVSHTPKLAVWLVVTFVLLGLLSAGLISLFPVS